MNILRSAVLLSFLVLVAGAQGPLRVATWNVESLGPVNSLQWTGAQAILSRMGAAVVAVQEVSSGDVTAFPAFSAQAGYPYSALSSTSGTLSGGFRGAVISQYPVVFSQSHSAASISGDPAANDITRDIFEVHVQPPGLSLPVGIFVIHLKAGTGSENDFRRVVEILRLAAVVSAFQASHPGAAAIIAGDFNEDLMDGPFGWTISSLPSGLPSTYSLGSDIVLPVIYEPFATFFPLGFAIADATREDTTNDYVTRPTSGRRLDYLLTTVAQNQGDEVYDSGFDNGFDDPPIGNWLAKWGVPLAPSVSLQASDHNPVFADFNLVVLPQLAFAISQPVPCNDITFMVSGAAPNSELFNLIALECSNPPGSGPLFGLSASPGAGPILDQVALPLGTDPFHVFADSTGSYAHTIFVGGMCAGLTLAVEGVSLELQGGLVTQISPTTGCVGISF